MIEVRLLETPRGEEDIYCPVAICDHCGGVVLGAEGNYLHTGNGPLYVAHKQGPCTLAVEAAYGADLSWELDQLPGQLAINLVEGLRP